VAADVWRDEIGQATAAGGRFAGAWASGRAWSALLLMPGAHHVLRCETRGGHVDTIIDLIQAAIWDEREAHDLHGLVFAGHDPVRALVNHAAELERWTTPVTGEGVHQVAVGPIHAGVIESGHFRFHVVGERILAIDPRLFYKHRGLERAAIGQTPDGALAHAGRACAACHAANTIAYAHAIEDALGLTPDRQLRIARTLLLELERLYNHLHDIGAICAGVGLAAGTMAFAALKDRAQEINGELTGHRFLFNTVRVGCSELALGAAATDAARQRLRDIRVDAAAAWRELEFTASLQARLDGVGILTRGDAIRFGAVGPAARASGIDHDERTASSLLAYSGFAPAQLTDPSGDVAARLCIRATELESTCTLLDDLLAAPLSPGTAIAEDRAATNGVGIVESPRGTTTCTVELTPGTNNIARLHLRTGSYANWPALAHATAGNLLPDFPLINKSFELCYACVDR
jgi:Ni,Fe-hydrogenase III large subunit